MSQKPIYRLPTAERRKALAELPKGGYVVVDYTRRVGTGIENLVVGELLGLALMTVGQTSDALIVKPGAPGSRSWKLQVIPASVIIRVQNVGFTKLGGATTGSTLAGPDLAPRYIDSTDFAGKTR